MKILQTNKNTNIQSELKRPLANKQELEALVSRIISDVREKGHQAVIDYTLRYDGVMLSEIEVSVDEISRAGTQVNDKLKAAIRQAKKNIELFHASQKTETKIITTMPGVHCWQKNVAVSRVGLYVPGGSAPLFSTLLMLAVPAKVAACKEIIICSPPNKQGNIDPAILYAASVTGAARIFKIGGVQAIAAMAYGTTDIPRVDKIFGPGNQYVTMAKQLVAKDGIAIDLPAGPSEVMIVADESAIPGFIAADMLSQAEHGVDSQSVLLTTSQTIARDVADEIEKQRKQLSRTDIINEALKASAIIITENQNELIDIMNDYAPEHLILAVNDPEGFAENVVNAGSVFLGNYSPESVGDYASGTNHTLPTNGSAKGWSGVSLDSFMKKITFQKISEQGLKTIAPIIETMAMAEKLDGHAMAVRRRIEKLRGI